MVALSRSGLVRPWIWLEHAAGEPIPHPLLGG
jgi:hypothetical protein